MNSTKTSKGLFTYKDLQDYQKKIAKTEALISNKLKSDIKKFSLRG
jgi:hypothetical protein